MKTEIETIEQLPPELQEQVKKAMAGATSSEPHMRIQSGSVVGTLWKNSVAKDGQVFDSWNASIVKRYKDKKEVWQSTSNFQTRDLFDVTRIATKLYDEIKARR